MTLRSIARARPHRRAPSRRSRVEQRELLEELVYELLDAHGDTARLAAPLAGEDERWEMHVAYLRDLQRVGREILARDARDSALDLR